MRQTVLALSMAVASVVLMASPASAALTFSPDPPIAGQDLTIDSSVDWGGCSAPSGNWTYTQTVTLIAPDGTETIFSVISESGVAPAGAQTLTGSDTQTLPPVPVDYTVRTTTRSFCGRLGSLSSVSDVISVAEDATVPVANPPVAIATLATSGLGLRIWQRRNASRRVAS